MISILYWSIGGSVNLHDQVVIDYARCGFKYSFGKWNRHFCEWLRTEHKATRRITMCAAMPNQVKAYYLDFETEDEAIMFKLRFGGSTI